MKKSMKIIIASEISSSFIYETFDLIICYLLYYYKQNL